MRNTATITEASTETENSSRWDSWEDGAFPVDVAARLATTGLFSPAALEAAGQLANELATLLTELPADTAVDRFLADASDHQEFCDRYAALRIFERLSQINATALERPRWTHPDPNARRRVLTDLEIGLVRYTALKRTQAAAVVGALDSGAATGELSAITDSSVRFTAPTATLDLAGTLRPGSSGFTEASPRTREIAAWAVPAFQKLAESVSGSLLYTGSATDKAKVDSCIGMAANKVLRETGLSQDPTVKPMAIRNTLGRAIYDQHGLEAAANALGIDDFTVTAREIGIRPHRPVG